ncbi:MAG: hypothetical protein QM840_05525, partial [Verrucomicrobiota bacterium]|nr:hypothetical protein [Verrucomicrobiota bacterium]
MTSLSQPGIDQHHPGAPPTHCDPTPPRQPGQISPPASPANSNLPIPSRPPSIEPCTRGVQGMLTG